MFVFGETPCDNVFRLLQSPDISSERSRIITTKDRRIDLRMKRIFRGCVSTPVVVRRSGLPLRWRKLGSASNSLTAWTAWIGVSGVSADHGSGVTGITLSSTGSWSRIFGSSQLIESSNGSPFGYEARGWHRALHDVVGHRIQRLKTAKMLWPDWDELKGPGWSCWILDSCTLDWWSSFCLLHWWFWLLEHSLMVTSTRRLAGASLATMVDVSGSAYLEMCIVQRGDCLWYCWLICSAKRPAFKASFSGGPDATLSFGVS